MIWTFMSHHNPTSVAWGGEFAWWVLDDGLCVDLRLALIKVIKFLGGGGYVQQALVSLSIGNNLPCPEDKSTHTQTFWGI